MKIALIFFLIAVTVISNHVIHHFTQDIKSIRTHYLKGDTSRVFSIIMKMHVQTLSLYQQLDIIRVSHNNDNSDKNCTQRLAQIYQLLITPKWVENYQLIFTKTVHLQQKCTSADFISRQHNGFDDKCALCTVLTRIMQNYITYHRKDVAKFVQDQFCSLFDGLIKPTCEAFIHYMSPYLIKGFLKKQNTDVICHSSGMCKNPECKILDKRSTKQFNFALQQIGEIKQYNSKPSPWKWIVDLFTDHFGDKHLPPFDLDNDTFSDISTFRGYHWRGSDCNQFNKNIYPGRKTGKNDLDHDCNGIFGVNQKGKSLEEQLCSESTRLGVAVIGDSAGAHFSIPQKFFNVTMMQKGTFKDLLPRIADQLDIPQQSGYTGHSKTTYSTHSIYKKLRKWNLCNNNDYQNVAVNGGDSGNTWGNIKALKRDQKNDHPMLVFLQLIGNDVCGSSLNGMTQPAKFKQNILKLLNYLDTTLPKGSHLFIMGLADGDLLFQYLHGTKHPLDVLYDEMYDFLNCLKISPCAGWLNTNDSAREYTTRWAKKLSKVYQEIINEKHTFNNFDILYYDFPTQDIFKRMYLQNRQPREMIQRCDGFHPSVLFNSYLADWMWMKILNDAPSWLGSQNKNNQIIKKLFNLQDLD